MTNTLRDTRHTLQDTWRVAEIHYFRVPRERWDLMILRARQSGANAISTYIPWIHHEPVDGDLDLTGRTLAERDLVGFVEVCAAAGLGFIAKPGPFVDSEMLGGGVPTWLIEAHPDWWAHDYRGEVYRHSDSYDPRLSYDCPGYQERATQWLLAVADALAPFVGGALWAWQIDNETPGDGILIHESDDAASPLRADFADTGRWQAWLEHRYGSIVELNDEWATTHASFAAIELPRAWVEPGTVEALRPWSDLDQFADDQMGSGLGAWATAVGDRLAEQVLLFHDWSCMPWELSGMMIDPGLMADTCNWVGQNVYAEDVDPETMIAGTNWYKMSHEEYVHHAWWRTRLCHTLSPAGLPHLVPEISARQAFYLQCSLVGGMDAPCIYMLHSSDPEPVGIGAFERWAEEAPVLPDGTVFPWWWNMRCLFLCLEAGGADLAASPLAADVAIAYDHAGERIARYGGVIDGAGFDADTEVAALVASANTSAEGMRLARTLVDAGVEFDVVDATRNAIDRYDVVVVPPTSVMSREAQQRLADRNGAAPGTVRRSGPAPTHDEDLRPLALLADLPLFQPPPASPLGVDVGRRVGAAGRHYLTVVNRSASRWTGQVDVTADGRHGSIPMSVGAASVSWAAVDPATGDANDDDAVVAALLHGKDAAVGDLRSSAGQVAMARIGESWHVMHDESCRVTVPGAAGTTAWRVTLAGKVLDAGTVDADGGLDLVWSDDKGQSDRYVIGERSAADDVAAPVRHFQLTTFGAVGEACAAIGIEASEVTQLLRRGRSALAAGSATDEQLAQLEPLRRIAMRMNDLRLGES